MTQPSETADVTVAIMFGNVTQTKAEELVSQFQALSGVELTVTYLTPEVPETPTTPPVNDGTI